MQLDDLFNYLTCISSFPVLIAIYAAIAVVVVVVLIVAVICFKKKVFDKGGTSRDSEKAVHTTDGLTNECFSRAGPLVATPDVPPNNAQHCEGAPS